jgi:molecular chaperone HtpG
MNADELAENLGTIAHSGARAFLKTVKVQDPAQPEAEGEALPPAKVADIIGQFGVGFYSVFMVAESVRVTSRSFRPADAAATWFCTGGDTFTIEPSDRAERGTTIEVRLKPDAAEFARPHRLQEIIRKHSDFIPFPIYLEQPAPTPEGEPPAGPSQEQANRRTALWRQPPHQTKKEDYDEFYRQLTLDYEAPLTYTHLAADAPVQLYAVLYVPASAERGMFSLRRDDGLKLYARKVLIQEYTKDLLPEYLEFIQGVVDSEDLPLNVSRESVQSNRVMSALKKLVTSKALDMLSKLAQDKPEDYAKFWREFGRYLKRGIASEMEETPALHSLLRFHTTAQPEAWSSLEEVRQRMPEEQPAVYYILGDDERSLRHSPHLDAVRSHGYEVLLLADPLDPFVLMRLKEFQGKPLVNVANADLKLPEKTTPAEPEPDQPAPLPAEDWAPLVDRFKVALGDRVQDVRMTDRLTGSPARLVDPEGAMGQELQRVYRYLRLTGSAALPEVDDAYSNPKKILELNPAHPILIRLAALDFSDENAHLLGTSAIEQLFENALLIEGLHQDPASMVARIHSLIEKALQ